MAKISKNTDIRINTLGVAVTSTTMQEVLTKIGEICQKKTLSRPFFITTVNPEFIILAQDDADFKTVLNGSDMALADGAGLRFASRKLAEIIPGRKLVEALATEAKYRSTYKIFYLGGKSGVAHKMAEMYGGEWDSGEENISKPSQNTEILAKIRKYDPDILFVAYGAPYQEKWIAANLDRIRARVVMGVGGSFDYLTGLTSTPPNWVNKIGLEWFWRLLHQPWRLKRQLKLIKFILLVLVRG